MQNRSGHCKMLQICSPCQTTNAPTLHFKQTNTLNLPTCHAAQTLQVSNLLPSKAVTWQGCNITPICRLQLQVLVAEQVWPLQDVATQLLPTCLQHCTVKQINTLNLQPVHAALTLVAKQSCHLVAIANQPKSILQASYTNLHRVPAADQKQIEPRKLLQICSPCQANPTL